MVPAYRLYYSSLACNWVGANMQTLANTLLAYRITGSVLLIAIMTLASSLPALVLSLLGGAVADRIQKKYLLFVGRLGTSLTALVVAIPLTTGYLSPQHPESSWILILSSLMQGLFMGFIQPSLMAIIPEIVGKERVMNAISLSTMGQTVFRLVGPTLAGFLIDSSGFTTVYYLIAALNVISAILVIFLPRIIALVSSEKRSGTIGNIIESLKYAWREPIFLFLGLFALCHMLGGIPFMNLLPAFTESILKISATQLGILNSASAVGSFMIMLFLASRGSKKRGAILLSSGILTGLAVIVFANSYSWYLSLGMMAFAGAGMSLHAAMTAVIVQTEAKPDYRARMQGIVSMIQSLNGFGTFLAVALSGAVGLQMAVGATAGFLVVMTIVFWIFAKRLRNLE
jgi:MFS family permease